jgi:hypothetical protein
MLVIERVQHVGREPRDIEIAVDVESPTYDDQFADGTIIAYWPPGLQANRALGRVQQMTRLAYQSLKGGSAAR